MNTKLFLIVVGFFATVGDAYAATPIAETRSVKANATIEVSNVKGAVVISGWDREEVSIGGSLGAGGKGLSIEGGADHLSIKVQGSEKHGWFGFNDSLMEETRLEIKVPRQVSLKLEVVSAEVSVTDVAGKSLEVDGVSGKLKFTCSTEELKIESVSGDVELNGQATRSSIETVSGDIDAQGIAGRVRLETVSGRIRLRSAAISEVTASTVSGEIEIHSAPEAAGRIEAESMSGNLRLFLPAALSARIEAETFSGSLKTEFGEVVHEEYGPGSTLNARIGGADARISAKSFSGNVELRRDQ